MNFISSSSYEIMNIYNEIEVSSQYSLDSELTSIDLNIQQYNVQRIKHNRNRPRSNNGSIVFDVIWEDDSETRESIQNLINKEDKIVNIFILDIIDDYKKTAIKYPRNNRCCIMCWNKVYNGAFICNYHMLMYAFLCE